MTGLTPRLHSIALRGGVAPTELSEGLQEQQIYNPTSGRVCEKCAALTYECMRTSERSPIGQIHHKNWKCLVEAAQLGCRLCTFFTVAALHPKSKPGKAFYLDQSGPIHIKIEETWKTKVVCLHMYVPQDKHSAVYYLYLSTDTSGPVPQCEIKMNDSERNRLSSTAFSKITGWIQTCQTQHSSCRASIECSLPTRVIDVSPTGEHHHVRLVEGDDLPQAKYVALSHCWGNMPPNSIDLVSKCDESNIDSLRRGVEITRLPKLYQDAIHLTKALGERYTWIDSLCIIQDSKEDWANECERMSDVYSRSYLTVSAMSYENNLQGFQIVRSENMPPHCVLCPLPGHPGTHVSVRSMVDHESRADYLKTRGWAFQELLLSPRVLHFTTTAMAFECDTCTIMERGPRSDSLFGYDEGRKRLVYAADNLHLKYYDRWLQIVQSYSHLKLTYDSDRLPALSGIACLVASKTNDQYVAGLWKRDIVAGLLWYVWPCRPLGSTYIAPSWSWASPPAVWTFDPQRRGFLKLDVVEVYTQLATSNPYGEISTAHLVVSGPLKQCAANQLVKKGQRFFGLKDEESLTVRFAFDIGHVDTRVSKPIWFLDCTIDKTRDVEMARLSKRRESFLRPHGLILDQVQGEESVFKRIGAFEVFDVPGQCSDWHETGFVTTRITII